MRAPILALALSACSAHVDSTETVEGLAASREQPREAPDCDPGQRWDGAACGCVAEAPACPAIGLCLDAYHWDEERCECVRDETLPVGETCGATICAPGMVCCNHSCGICTPPDGVCIQQFCTS